MDWPAYILLLAGVLVNGIWYTALMVPYATNRHGRIAVSYTLIYGAAALGLAYLGAIALGLIGVALALLLAEIVMAVIVLRASLTMVDMSMSKWVKAVLPPPRWILSQAATVLRRRFAAGMQ